jgi:hypothetical protein
VATGVKWIPICSLIKISNPSPTDLMFIAAIPQFGIEYTIFLAKEFEWKCERVARALAEYALSEPADAITVTEFAPQYAAGLQRSLAARRLPLAAKAAAETLRSASI